MNFYFNGRYLRPFFYGHFFERKVKSINTKNIEVNERIRDAEVRVIGEDGSQLGVMSSKEAYFKAKDMGLDLVKISPNANPPVCKIVDFGKYRYELEKKEKEAKKNQTKIELKEIRMTPNIEENDLNTKVTQARKFLEKGNKLKVTLRFRGREVARMDIHEHVLHEFAEKLSDISTVEKKPLAEGRNMSIVLVSKK